MVETKKKTRRGRGLVGAFFTGTLIIVAGFAIGVVAGLAMEDPSLVADYATGATRQVGVEKPEPASSEPPVRSKKLDPRRGFSIQVGAFADVAAARGLAERLESVGYPVYILRPEDDPAEESSRFKVRVGPILERERAEDLATRLKSDEALPTWIIDESA